MSTDKPSLFVLTHRCPSPPDSGDKIRLYNLLRHLHAEWEIDLLCFAPWDSPAAGIAELSSFCRSVEIIPSPRGLRMLSYALPRRKGVKGTVSTWKEIARIVADPQPRWIRAFESPAMQAEIRAKGRLREADRVLLSGLPMTQYVPDAGIRRKTVYDQVDAYYVNYPEVIARSGRQERVLLRAETFKMRRLERTLASSYFGRCVVVSGADAHALKSLTRDARVDVVPNGVDTAYWKPGGVAEPNHIVFTGGMGYGPNVDAMGYFVSQIMPRVWDAIPTATLSIVGHSPSSAVRRLASDRVTVTGWVEDVRPYVARASVYVAPIRYGSGTHVKVLEALAMAKPVVTTSRGSQGLGLTSGTHCRIADDPTAMVEGIVCLLRDPEAARSLGEAGRARMVQRHDWSVSARMLHGLLLDATSRHIAP